MATVFSNRALPIQCSGNERYNRTGTICLFIQKIFPPFNLLPVSLQNFFTKFCCGNSLFHIQDFILPEYFMKWNRTFIPWNKTLSPWNRASIPWSETLPPWDKASTPWNESYPLWNKIAIPWNKTSPPWDKISPPWNEALPP